MAMAEKKTTPEERGFYRMSLRIPVDLKLALDEVRTEEERSLHEQIMWCLRQCMKQSKRGGA